MRLIDADALKDLILQRFDMPDLYLLAHIIHLIDETPTTDMELPRDKIVTYSYDHEIGEVIVHKEMLVRCKECKHAEWRDNFDPPISQYFCEFMDANVELKGDDFCSKGERREETE